MEKGQLRLPRHKIVSLLNFVIYIVMCGGVIGTVAALFLQIMHKAIELLWTIVPNAIPSTLSVNGVEINVYPVVICIVGGILIGILQKKYGDYPRTLAETIKTYKSDKSLSYNNLPMICMAALLPLVFGGSIGPEAGLAGIVAGLLCWFRDRYKTGLARVLVNNASEQRTTLKAMLKNPLQVCIGSELTINNQSYTISKRYRWTIYAIAAIGGASAFRLIGEVLASEGMKLAHFEPILFSLNEWLAFIPLVIAGIICGVLFLVCERFSRLAFAPLANQKILRAVIAGALLGVVGMFMPYTMFSGEEQMYDLVNSWQSWAAPMLFITGLVKMVTINLCISGGWRGGNFFPILFSSTAIGFSLCTILPVDATFVVLTFMAAYTATALGHPVIVSILCMLFAPLNAIPAIVISAYVGGKAHLCWRKNQART